MIKGMTGFGTAQFSVGRVKGLIEVKSVNQRFLDLKLSNGQKLSWYEKGSMKGWELGGDKIKPEQLRIV